MNKYFHFTIGPVQGFVAQARRTRDFWAGSFILSWLVAVAMRAVTAQKGEIISPKADENFLAWLGDKKAKKTGEAPRQGNIPNRFTAEVNDGFNPDKVEQSVQNAWCELADLVWQNLAEIISDRKTLGKTAEIWTRQVDHFWEISWALTEDDEELDLLDRRKNLRNHFSPIEDGVKCTVMEGWQELSGTPSPNKKKLKEFWQPIQKKYERDLAKNNDGVYENLCAIAFIKRRFTDCFKKLGAIKPIEMPGDWKLKGWDLNIGVPSVSFMAAVPWLKKVIATKDVSQLENLVSLANELGGGNQKVSIKCIKNALNSKNLQLKTSDGDVFFENELSNKNKYSDEEKVKKMLGILKEIATKPSPFYAILLMDGDSLGSKMGDKDNRKDISAALHTFTNEVADKVEDNNGFLIYAGGDDVLAILPVPHALQCAADIRQIYQDAFKSKNANVKNSTISAAIEFVHTHTPLTTMLKDAHNLLDDVAKDGCGRNAVAVRVWKRGGKALEWAMPWEIALEDNKFVVENLLTKFQDKQGNEAGFSSKFFYNIRERFKMLGAEANIFTPDEECTLLAVDYMNSGVNETRIKEKQLDLAKAKQEIAPLLKQCRSKVLKPDGALLIRFLAKEGMKYD